MLILIVAAASFATLHLVLSGTRVRDKLVSKLGEGLFRGLFSLATVGTLVALRRAYSSAYASDNQFYWALPYAQHVAGPLMLVALFFVVAGIMTKSPTGVGQEKLLASDPAPVGIQRITRHPFLWGVTLWAAFHLAANGDLASIVLFTTFLIVAVAGTASIDRKRDRMLGDAWRRYAARTSNLPFAALFTRRTAFSFGEFGLVAPIVTLVTFAIIVWLHPVLFHADALPHIAR
jgi:uncharacterized membrane protein